MSENNTEPLCNTEDASKEPVEAIKENISLTQLNMAALQTWIHSIELNAALMKENNLHLRLISWQLILIVFLFGVTWGIMLYTK